MSEIDSDIVFIQSQIREYNNQIREYNLVVREYLNMIRTSQQSLHYMLNRLEALHTLRRQRALTRNIVPPLSSATLSSYSPLSRAFTTTNPIITRRSYSSNNGDQSFEIDATIPLDMSAIGQLLTTLLTGTVPTTGRRGLPEDDLRAGVEEIMYNPSLSCHHCPISWEEFEEGQFVYRIRHCGHIFNKENLTNWFQQHTECPLCRYDLSSTNRDANETMEDDNSSIHSDSSESVSDVDGT